MSNLGCRTQVAGQQRPLVHYSPLQFELELSAEQRRDEEGIGDDKRRFEAFETEELLGVRTEGNVYHPDLLSYQASVGLGLTQNSFELDGQTDRDTGTIEEYHLGGQLLRAKPYPVHVQLDKSEQWIARQFASSLLSEREAATLAVSYQSDWPMRLQVGQSSTRQEGQSPVDRDLFELDDRQIAYALDHDFSDRSSMHLDLHRNDTSQTQGGVSFDRIENVLGLSHTLSGGQDNRNRLDSFVNYLDQSGDFDLERLIWQERLRFKHTDVFETQYQASYHESRREQQGNDEIRGQAGLTHRLYQSLVSRADIHASKSDLGDGVVLTRLGGTLGLDYQKKNRWGVLFGFYGFFLQDLSQTGGGSVITVVNERHPFSNAGSLRIRLERTQIDPDSIVVFNGTRTKVYFDYTVSQFQGVTEINVILGGDISADGSQTLSIDYQAVTEPQRDELTTIHTFRIRERFKGNWSTYYEYQRRQEDVDSEDTTLIPDEFQINLFGIDYNIKGLRLLAEYRDEQSTRIPSTGQRIEASYLWALDAQTRLNVHAGQSWIEYHLQPPYDVQLLTLGGTVTHQLNRLVSMTSRVDYRQEQDSREGDTTGLQGRVTVDARYRQVDATLGAEFNALNRFTHEREGFRVYARVKRTF